MKKQLLAGALAVSLLAACSQQLKTGAPADTAPSRAMSEAPAPPSASMKSGIDVSNMDTAVRPQDDFFRYVNGTWLKTVEIPADKSSYGAFVALRDKAREDVKAIIEETARIENKKPGSAAQKVGDLYNSFLDTERLEMLGITPLNGELAKIDAIAGKKDLAGYFAHVLKLNTNAPFYFWVNNDAKNPTEYVVYLTQGGLGLPDRDYYFTEDEKSVTLRNQYVEHVGNMLRLAGMDNAEQKAKDIMALETDIAGGHWTRVESRDRDKTYNKVEAASLNDMLPGFDWNAYLTAAGIAGQPFLIVRQPSYYEKLNAVMENTSLETWKAYFKWHLLTNYAGYLNSALDQENFRFYGTVLRGTPEQEERWKRGVGAVNGVLGEMVGQVYVQKHFKPAAKARMVQLVENLREAYRQGIIGLEWMGEDTKQQALEKLAKFRPKIGYPDKWRDYSGLNIKAGDLTGNIMRSNDFAFAYQLNKLGKPINRDEWHMSPQTVNAYYNPGMNEIVFPAAILQPPFFFMDADDAVNYGSIGAVIGHEMGHGFDDQGSKSDGDGLQQNWWTEQDLEEFKKRTGKLVAQYNAFEPLPGEHVNGELTLGENIGDLGGLTIAYKAYQLSLKGKPAPMLEGFTGDQRVFLGWGQVWAYKFRDEALLQRIKTDSHSPAEYRVNGVLPNMPEFVEAFEVKEGDGMYLPPEERVKIW